jgi:hypothetical protein
MRHSTSQAAGMAMGMVAADGWTAVKKLPDDWLLRQALDALKHAISDIGAGKHAGAGSAAAGSATATTTTAAAVADCHPLTGQGVRADIAYVSGLLHALAMKANTR